MLRRKTESLSKRRKRKGFEKSHTEDKADESDLGKQRKHWIDLGKAGEKNSKPPSLGEQHH